jgi:hypothetical protein
MTRREQRVITAFSDRSGLPSGAFTALPYDQDARPYLKIWLNPAFLHSAHGLPKMIQGVKVVVEPTPMARAYPVR